MDFLLAPADSVPQTVDILETRDVRTGQVGADADEAARIKPTKKAIWRTVLKIALPLLALFAATSVLDGLDLAAVWRSMIAVPAWVLALAVVTALLQSALLVLRFWGIFPRKKRPSVVAAARAYAYSQSANVYLPARAGEVLRVVAVSREAARQPDRSRPSVADATSATVLDRVLDVAAFIVMALVFGKSFLFGAVVTALSWGWVVAGGIVLLVCIGWLLRKVAPQWFAKARAAVREARSAARSLVSAKRFSIAIVLGLLSWVAELGTMLLLAHGLGIHITPVQMTISLIVLNLGIAIPVSFANIGAYEAATVIGLAPFGVGVTEAIALGTLHHIIQLVGVFLPALVLFVHERWSERARRRRARRGEAALTVPELSPSFR